MVSRSAIILALLCAVFCGYGYAGSNYVRSRDSPVPRLTLNLDLPPEQRWDPVLRHWNIKDIQRMWTEALQEFVPKEALPLIDAVGEALDDLLPYPYSDEIRGVAKTLNISTGQIACLNMLYDFTAACTSIIAQDTNGTIWHARNLDYDLTDFLRNLTMILDFQSKGQTLYTTTGFAGQVGVFTGMKAKKFTITLNERDRGSYIKNFIEALMALLFRKVQFTTLLIRDALANDNSWDEVVQRFTTLEEVAPAYLIVAGMNPGEGVVITRDRVNPVDVWRLDAANDRWFLLETNYDHWMTPPPDDDRRDPGNKAMNAVGQKNINNNTMWDVLSTQPVLNNETVYTALMSAAKPEIYSSVVRDLL